MVWVSVLVAGLGFGVWLLMADFLVLSGWVACLRTGVVSGCLIGCGDRLRVVLVGCCLAVVCLFVVV